MLTGLHHVGIAVADLSSAVELYTRVLAGRLLRQGRLGEVDFALIQSGGTELELLASSDPESAIGKFVAERGPGLHHLAYATPDLEADRAALAAAGHEQSGEVRVGVHGTPIVFFHPRNLGGVLTELVQETP